MNQEGGSRELSSPTSEVPTQQSPLSRTAIAAPEARGSDPPNSEPRSHWLYTWWDVAIGRARRMDKLRTDIKSLRELVPPPGSRPPEDSSCDPRWAEHVTNYLVLAECECNAHRPTSGWVYFHDAEEWRVEGLAADELLALSLSLERELVSGVAADRRIAAAYDLIRQTSYRHLPFASTAAQPATHSVESSLMPQAATPGNEEMLRCNRALIRQAVRLRGQYENQRHLVLELAAARRLFLLGIGVVFLCGAFAIAREHVGGAVIGVAHPWVVASAVVAGALGSITSAIQRLASDPHASATLIPGSFTSTLTRPFIGSIAALTVFLAVDGGVLNLEGDDDVPVLLLASFAAGFTERLIVYQGSSK
jgi:hypothetical protein